MGRGTNQGTDAAAPARRGEAEGEIALLDADRLEDHAGVASGGIAEASEDADERAIASTVRKLRRTSHGSRLSDEALEDQAIALYNRLCELITSGEATAAQETQAAALFDEPIEELRARLEAEQAAEEDAPEDEQMNPAGVGSLLSALRG